jgi:hypothetical protein
MKVDRVTIHPGDQQFNNQALREGVMDARCTIRMSFMRDSADELSIADEVRPFLHEGERFSSMEVYLNGGVNFFVRDAIKGEQIAYIRVRPSTPIIITINDFCVCDEMANALADDTILEYESGFYIKGKSSVSGYEHKLKFCPFCNHPMQP